jgi:hypothetical protein
MKTQIITLFTALVLVTGITATTYAAPAKYNVVTTLKEVSPISKIEVRGNVELYISDGAADEVKVYNKYYTESARVQVVNGVLQVASYKAEKLVVWVTAADLRSVSAYDNSVVKSFGNLSKIELNVDLHNNASAKLNLDAYSAEVTVSDHASAELTGSATEFRLNNGVTSTVNRYNFTAAHFTENKTFIPAPEVDELVGI